MIQKTDRIAVLDGLRALAILLVLMRHLIRPFWLDMSTPFFKVGPVDLASFFANGWIGVDLFFVLSGFLITSHLMGRYFDAQRKAMHLGDYFKRRFLRIAPAYYVILTLAVLGLFPYYPYPESADQLGWRYLYHLLFLQDYLPSDIIVVFWSLALEVKFYLLAPIVLMGILRIKQTGGRLAILGLVFIAAALLRWISAQQNAPVISYEFYFEQFRSIFHLGYDGLVAGMFCAVAWKDPKIRAFIERPAMANTLFLSGLALFLLLSLAFGPLVDLEVSFFDKVFLSSAIALAFGAMLLGLRAGALGSRFFAWRGWFPVALISYSLYLVHLPVMYAAEIFCLRYVDLSAYAPQWQLVLYTPFYLAMLIAVASLSYALLERPFLRRR